MHPSRYLAICLLATAATLALVSALNILVEPYDVFGSLRVEGFNAKKLQASNYTAIAKAHQIERVAPRTVLFGTSRVDIAADPGHIAWTADAAPIYNYGLPESSILSLEKQLRHSLSAGPVHRVVIGLEFHDFLRTRIEATHRFGEIEARFVALAQGRTSAARLQQLFVDKANAALTLKALTDSITTVAGQRGADAGDMNERGLTSEAPYAGLASRDGLHALFLQKDQQIAQARLQAATTLTLQPAVTFPELVYVRSLIEFCQSNGIELTLFIPPYHAHYLEIVDATGLWDRFEALKVALTVTVHESQAAHGPRVRLWDFASYDEYTTEAVPAEGERRATMTWFWETVHFTKALGDLMLARMLAADSSRFGVELTPDTIDTRLAETRLQRAAYRQRLPKDAQDTAALVRSEQIKREATAAAVR